MRSAPNSIATLRENGIMLQTIAADFDLTKDQLGRIARGDVQASAEMTAQLDQMATAVAGPRLLPVRHVGVTRRYGR